MINPTPKEPEENRTIGLFCKGFSKEETLDIITKFIQQLKQSKCIEIIDEVEKNNRLIFETIETKGKVEIKIIPENLYLAAKCSMFCVMVKKSTPEYISGIKKLSKMLNKKFIIGIYHPKEKEESKYYVEEKRSFENVELLDIIDHKLGFLFFRCVEAIESNFFDDKSKKNSGLHKIMKSRSEDDPAAIFNVFSKEHSLLKDSEKGSREERELIENKILEIEKFKRRLCALYTDPTNKTMIKLFSGLSRGETYLRKTLDSMKMDEDYFSIEYVDIKIHIDKLDRVFQQIKSKELKFYTISFSGFGEKLTKIPSFLTKCFQYLELFYLNEEGLFRRSPNKREYMEVKTVLLAKKSYSLCKIKNVNVISSLIKDYFRQLPTSPFPIEKFLKYNDLENYNQKLYQFQKSIFQLDQVNFKILKLLFNYLKMIADNSKTNLMEARNLATVFSPSIVQMAMDAKTAKTKINASIEILTFIIENSNLLFNLKEYEEFSFIFNDDIWKNTKSYVEEKFSFLWTKEFKQFTTFEKEIKSKLKQQISKNVRTRLPKQFGSMKEENAKFKNEFDELAQKVISTEEVLKNPSLQTIFDLVKEMGELRRKHFNEQREFKKINDIKTKHFEKYFDEEKFKESEIFKEYSNSLVELQNRRREYCSILFEIEDETDRTKILQLKNELSKVEIQKKTLIGKIKNVERKTKFKYYKVQTIEITAFFQECKKQSRKEILKEVEKPEEKAEKKPEEIVIKEIKEAEGSLNQEVKPEPKVEKL